MKHRGPRSRLPAVLCGLILAVACPLSTGAGGYSPPIPGVCAESDRFGVWSTTRPIESYDVEQLHAGWYSSWDVELSPSQPADMWFAQLVRISDDGPFPDAACSACPSWEETSTIAERNPGSLWLIGNEPDRQDYVTAESYARIYRDFYAFLKGQDPSCLVAIGGVVQPTPIRLQYLDMILAAYRDQFGEQMPVDVWNTHNYVLREGVEGWGCGIPAGTDPALAIDYDIQQHDDIEIWTQHLVALREWMRDRGYQDRPLIVSEFGILMPYFFGYDYERVTAFMQAAFDWLLSTADPAIGYATDGYRLVQAWNWYSLDHKDFEGLPTWSHLFDPDTLAITSLGLDYGAYTAPLETPFAGSIDLRLEAIAHSLPEISNSGLLTVTVTAEVHNAGATPAEGVVVRFERDGIPAGEDSIARVDGGEAALASVVWTHLDAGLYEVTVNVVASEETLECDLYNNALSRLLVVGEHQSFLPMISCRESLNIPAGER